ncbi:MAG: manganese efflux pump MntP family protein [Bacteroidales bacterium]|nr:manganese efflux pump MntP family protein [Bacteroidales bacterium]
MSFFELFLISLGLSMDCFAVSLSVGVSHKLKWKETFLIAFSFGLFQGLMPLMGWMLGTSIQTLIASIDHWIAFGILAVIGLRMVWQAIFPENKKATTDIRKLPVLLSLSIATSIDALITGVGFGFIKVKILEAVLLISITTFVISIAGVKLGEKTTFISSRWAEFLGGVILILIGTKILLEHLGMI